MKYRAFANRTLSICTFLLSAALITIKPAHCQLTLDPPPSDLVRKAINERPAEEAAVLEQAILEATPIIIFLPGTLGSELTKSIPRGTRIIWGQRGLVAVGAEMAYHEDDQVKASLLNEFTVPLLQPQSVYGPAASVIQALSLANGSKFLVFPYDWRQSNIKSANQFSEFLCANRRELRGRPIVFIAHSMGGLVLKYWLARDFHASTCDGERLDAVITPQLIKHVVFVGTPHLGAPKALGALADRYYLFADADSSFIKRYGDSLITQALNDYGGTFPSAYELLPQVSMKCSSRWQDPPVEMKVQTEHMPVRSIFYYDLWKEYQWPNGLFAKNPQERQKFMEVQLPLYLKNAEDMACLLSGYDIDKEFSVIRFYGTRNRPDTDCKIVIAPQNVPSRLPTIERVKCEGDGTVPAHSASETGKGKTQQLPAEHLQLLSTEGFTAFLRQLYASAARQMNQTFAEKRNSDVGPVDLYVAIGHVVPPNIEPETPAEARSNEITIKTNNAVAERIDELNREQAGTTARTIYQTAKNEKSHQRGNATARSDAYQVAANLSTLNSRSRAWAYNNSAHISLERKDFRKAKVLALKALMEAEAIEIADPDMALEVKRLNGLAAWTVAIAASKLGEEQVAHHYREIAIQNGNSNARRITMQ